MKVDIKYNRIQVQAEFNNGINIITGNSGSGKTVLLKATELHCYLNKIKHVYFSSKQMFLSKEIMLDICRDVDIVLMDNADLYLDEYLFNKIKTFKDKIFIICIKNTSHLDMCHVNKYLTKYENKKVTLKEF